MRRASLHPSAAWPTVRCSLRSRHYLANYRPVSGASEAKPGCAWRPWTVPRSTERLPTVGRAAQIPAAVGRLWSLRGFFWRKQKKPLRKGSQGACSLQKVKKIARMLSHTGNPRRCRGDPIITCTTRQVGRLPRATSLPTSGPWYREACNPRGDAASLIKNVGLKGSRQMPFRAQGRNKNRFGRRRELIPPPARQSPRHRRAGP